MNGLTTDPVTLDDRRRAVRALLEMAEDEGTADELRLSAATTIVHAPMYDVNSDIADDLAERVARLVNAKEATA